MASLEEACDNVLTTYDDCVYWYILLKQKRTRLRWNNLRRAFSDLRASLSEFTAILHDEQIEEDETWLFSNWYYEDRFENSDMYICPADMISEVEYALKE